MNKEMREFDKESDYFEYDVGDLVTRTRKTALTEVSWKFNLIYMKNLCQINNKTSFIKTIKVLNWFFLLIEKDWFKKILTKSQNFIAVLQQKEKQWRFMATVWKKTETGIRCSVPKNESLS